MSTSKLTPEGVELAVDHIGVLVLAGEHRSAAVVEQDLFARFLDATAKGLCTDPVKAAQHLLKLKELRFPRSHPKSCPCTRHKLDAILGPAPSEGGSTHETA